MDVHKITASDLFNVSIDYVSQEMRAIGKMANFGKLYNGRHYSSEYMDKMLKDLKDIIVVEKSGNAIRISNLSSPDYIGEAIEIVKHLGRSKIKKVFLQSWGDTGKKHPNLTLKDLYNMKMIEALKR